MACALDSQKRRVSVTAITASHRQYAPRPVAVIDPQFPLLAVQVIVARLADTQHKHGIGAYVFIDDDMRAFVLTEHQSVLPQWLKGHFAWLVGFYSRVKVQGVPLLVPTPAGVLEDVIEHLAGFAKEPA